MPHTFNRLRATALSISAVLAMLPLAGLAQPVPSPTAAAALGAGDPPDRVAHLNYFDGTVTLEPAGLADWSYAVVNRPLTTGDQLWVDTNARAELHAGSAAWRLNQQTALDIVNLSDTDTQLKLTQGTVSVHLRTLSSGQNFEVDTPNVALAANGPGLFRIEVAADGSSTTVTLRAGNATLYGNGASFQMNAGQQIRFVATNLQQQISGATPPPDSFDQWVAARDRAEDDSISARYVSREIPGYQDLDANGTWRNDPAYGEVWVPTAAVSAGWAPYHDGHWAWIAPWGWTWVDDAPWGFAPFHYGRWAYLDRAWAWVPGPVEAARPPVYAPALVAFVDSSGSGRHWGVDLAVGGAVGAGIAWFALGPGEPWHPAYHTTPAYYNRINYVNVTNVHNSTTINNVNVHNTYINLNAPGAIAAVPATAFVRGQPVAASARTFNPQGLVHARIGAGAPSLAPVQQSFAGALRPTRISAPAVLAERPVVATRAPVVPPAYRDTLAQRLAGSGGTVAGGGNPVVRNAPPTSAPQARPGRPTGVETSAGFNVVKRVKAGPAVKVGAVGEGRAARVPSAIAPAPLLPPQSQQMRAPQGKPMQPMEAGTPPQRAQPRVPPQLPPQAQPQLPPGVSPHVQRPVEPRVEPHVEPHVEPRMQPPVPPSPVENHRSQPQPQPQPQPQQPRHAAFEPRAGTNQERRPQPEPQLHPHPEPQRPPPEPEMRPPPEARARMEPAQTPHPQAEHPSQAEHKEPHSQ